MTNFWRPLVLAAAFDVMAGAGLAVAQTLVMTNAPAGGNVELVLNATPLGSAAADERGDATLPVDLQKNLCQDVLILSLDFCLIYVCPSEVIVPVR